MNTLYTLKTVFKPLALMLVLCLLNPYSAKGCNADFTYSIGSDGRTVTFTPVDATATTYYWDFGDAHVAATIAPVHTYGNFRLQTYNVGLMVVGQSCSDTVIKTISIGRSCEVYAHFYIEPDTVNFSGLVHNGSMYSRLASTVWTWRFGDGDSSNSINPTHVYPGPGDYILYLSLRDSACFSEFSDTISFDTAGNLKRGLPYSIKVFGGPETSIKEQNIRKNNVKVMPNPGNGLVKIECSEGLIKFVRILDPLGKDVFSVSMSDTLLYYDSSVLSSGVYFILVTDEKGNTQKIKFIPFGE